jgi:hypothetical protein
MKMQRREKILAYATGGLAVAVAGWFLLLGGDSRTDAQLEADRTQLTKDRDVKKRLVAADRRDAKRLVEWQRRALPSDQAIGRSRYQDWLRDLAIRSHFRQLSIDPREIGSPRDPFTRMSFTVHGRVALAELTQFLYEFYSAGHLHQIRQLSMKPVEHADELEVTLTVEALSLPSADRKDQLSKEPGHGLRLAKVEKYRDPVVKRNLFAPYTPPPAVGPSVAQGPPKRDPPVDSAQFAFVTGFTEVDGVPQVWIQDRIAGKVWKLNEGGKFKIGELNGTVRKIAATREVTLDFDGHRRRLRDGENLRGGVEIKGYSKN